VGELSELKTPEPCELRETVHKAYNESETINLDDGSVKCPLSFLRHSLFDRADDL
jgi:hypothetical protein